MRLASIMFFCLVVVADLVAVTWGLDDLHHWAKPLLMITLGVFYFISAGDQRSNLVLFAIFFSFLGDSFLLYEAKNNVYFLLGLSSFLIAHGFYIMAFRQHRLESGYDDGDQLYTVQKARMSFPVILAATGLVVVLFPHLGALRIPVLIYGGVLMFMVLNAVFRYRKTNPESCWMVLGGAVLFMASDSFLAVNKFLEPVPYAAFFIMLFYVSGQFLIVSGLLKHKENGA